MALTVGDIIQVLDAVAPAELAEQWDNIGLQVGARDRPVKSVWVALDPLPEVVSAACKNAVDLLVTHHPLIFQPVKSLDFHTPLGRILETAARHGLAIVSAHTNLDTTAEGLNDLLAEKIGLRHLSVLGESRDPEVYRLVLCIPEAVKRPVQTLLRQWALDADRRSALCGMVAVMTPAEPVATGDRRAFSGGMIRLEMRIAKKSAAGLLRQIRKICPEDAFMYDLWPTRSLDIRQGLGRVGELKKGTDLIRFAQSVKRKLGLKSVRVVGDPEMAVYKAAVCSGSGGGLLSAFFSTNAQVYVTGDLRYHDARQAEAVDRGLIDIGHFASEHIIAQVLAERLRNRLLKMGGDICVTSCGLEKDPFMIL